MVLQKDKPLSHYGIVPDTTNIIEFKDLGPQISWRTLYLTEYFGPFILYLWTYFRPDLLYGDHTGSSTPTYIQSLACICFLGHFGRRIFESAFVHKWSGDTLGLYFLAKNSAYYWLAGALVGYSTNHPSYTPIVSYEIIKIALIIFWVCQVANAWVHLQLSWSRPPGSVTKVMPRGFLWTITRVSFPNYFFEILIWITWNIAFFSIAGVLYLLVGSVQMGIWAKKKARNLSTDI